MPPFNVMALFCEDIREEKGDIVTLVGILPDFVKVEEASPSGVTEGQSAKFLSKLCIYLRINFDPTVDLGTPQVGLTMPNGERIMLGSIGADVVEKAKSQAKEQGNLLAGVISRVVLAGFRPPKGVVKVEVEISGETTLAGVVNFVGSP
jgi:hypothetical protein